MTTGSLLDSKKTIDNEYVVVEVFKKLEEPVKDSNGINLLFKRGHAVYEIDNNMEIDIRKPLEIS